MSATHAFEVITVGSAIVDVFAQVGDDELSTLGLHKGAMALVDLTSSERLMDSITIESYVGGGSAANTAVGLASFGVGVRHVGVCGDDELGREYVRQLEVCGVVAEEPKPHTKSPTGRCVVMVTPDGERTMSTYLGASRELSAIELNTSKLQGGSVLYVEGYLLDIEDIDGVLMEVLPALADAGTKIALSLSDLFVVQRHRDAVIELLRLSDIVFGNQSEALALAKTDDLKEALDWFVQRCPSGAVTLGAAGSVGFEDGEIISSKLVHDISVIDTTGAGDLFASGYLAALCHGRTLEERLRLGNRSAGEVISHLGARPLQPLSLLL